MKRFLFIDGSMSGLLRRLQLSIEGAEGGADGGDNVSGGGAPELSTAERALEFWDSDEKPNGADGGADQGAQKPGSEAAGAEAQKETEEAGKDGEQRPGGDLTDEQLQADPRYQELNTFRNEIQPVFDKYGIPDAKEADLQLADAAVLYQIMSGKAQPSQLLDVMVKTAGWSKDQVGSVANDMIGWLHKQGFLKDGAGQGSGQARGQDGKFTDPAMERLDKLEADRKADQERQQQQVEQQRQTKIFDSFRTEVGKLMEGKGLDKEDLDYYGREIRSLIPAEQFNAIVNRIEKGNFVDVKRLFDQVHNREAARLKRYTDKTVKTAARTEKTAPRVPAGGAPPASAGQQKRNLQNRDERLAAAAQEWDK